MARMLLSGKARLAGVIGWPIGHSLSPRLHGYWIERHGLDAAYVPLAVAPADVEAAFALLPRLGFLGWNVTLPHKEAAFRLVDAHAPSALRARSVNTVLVEAHGRTRGLSTDGSGFIANLRQQAPGWRAEAGPVTLLGTGGAARPVAVALLDAGVPALRLANRTARRAEALAEDLRAMFPLAGIEVAAWPDRAAALDAATACVNCSSLGMQGQPALELPLDALPPDSPVVDLVYVPLETELLRAARLRGNPAVDGLGMLIQQAVPGFRHWGGVEPEVDASTRAVLLQALAERR
jgi:shikimate dehydrogenase